MTRFRLGVVVSIVLAFVILVDAAAASDIVRPTPAVPLGAVPGRDYVPGEVVVRYRSPAAPAAAAVDRSAGAVARRPLALARTALLRLGPGASVPAVVARLRADPAVVFAEPNYLYRATALPDDPGFAQQWGLRNVGQVVRLRSGQPFADVDAGPAWDVLNDASSVTVAVIDTGVAADHVDLAANLVAGYDFVEDDPVPQDLSGHGTHVAGIIGAVGNNGVGIAGLAWRARIMPLRALNGNGFGTEEAVVNAIVFAARHGARVVNGSFEVSYFSEAVQQAILDAPQTLFVFAAGNLGQDLSDFGSYPCQYTHLNVLCVAATDVDDTLARFSNRSPGSVDLAAPGVDILSTYPSEATLIADGFEGDVGSRWDLHGLASSDDWSSEGARSLVVPGGDACVRVDCTATLRGAPLALPGEVCHVEVAARLTAPPWYPELRVEVRQADHLTPWDPILRIPSPSTGVFSGSFIRAYVAPHAPIEVRIRWWPGSSRSEGPAGYVDDLQLRCQSGAHPAAGYRFLSGTSMSAPFATAAAALVAAEEPDADARRIADKLRAGARPLPGLAGAVWAGALDVAGALRADASPPRRFQGGTIRSVFPAPVLNGITAVLRVRALADGGMLVHVLQDDVRCGGAPCVERVRADGTVARIYPWTSRPIAPLPDGSFLGAAEQQVVHVALDGTRRVVAGVDEDAFGDGDGGPARRAHLGLVQTVSAAPDGSFVLLAQQQRPDRTVEEVVRRVDTRGIIRTILRGGPLGPFDELTALPGGAFYLTTSETVHAGTEVFRVDVDGHMQRVAGVGRSGYAGDGGPAVRAYLRGAQAAEPLPDGGILIPEWSNCRVRRVEPDGTIETIAGTPPCLRHGDGGPATSAAISPLGVSATPDGGYLIADGYNGVVREVDALEVALPADPRRPPPGGPAPPRVRPKTPASPSTLPHHGGAAARPRAALLRHRPVARVARHLLLVDLRRPARVVVREDRRLRGHWRLVRVVRSRRLKAGRHRLDLGRLPVGRIRLVIAVVASPPAHRTDRTAVVLRLVVPGRTR